MSLPSEQSSHPAASRHSGDRSVADRDDAGPFDEDRVAALLVEFFESEMPAELRATTDPTGREPLPLVSPAGARVVAGAASPVRTTIDSHPATSARSGRLAGLIAAGTCLAVFVVAVQVSRPAGTPRGSDRNAGLADVDRADHPADDLAAATPREVESPWSPAFTLTEDDLFVERVEGRVESLDRERFETSRGPVELRAVRETTHVSVVEPATGREVELETQVLDIEVVPIELDTDPTFDTPSIDVEPDEQLPRPRADASRLPEAGENR